MPVGPLALTDEVGVDVANCRPGSTAPTPPTAWAPRSGRGFYRYDGRERKDADPAVYALLGLPSSRKEDADLGHLADRMVLPMVNEATRCLAEGVARSAADLDLAMIYDTGFPPFRGGLCRWADQEGLPQVIAALERLESAVSERSARPPAPWT